MSIPRGMCLLALLALPLPSPAATTVVASPGAAGRSPLVMENAAVRLTVDPANGGRISSLIWKATGTGWVLLGEAGLFLDHV